MDSETDGVEQIFGWALTLLLVVVTFGAVFAAGGIADARLATAPTQGAFATWRRGSDLNFSTFLAFAICLSVPGAFGYSRFQLLPRLSERGKAGLVASILLLIGGNTAAEAIQGGRDVGVATLEGAAWFEDGRLVHQRTWREARGVEITCRTSRSREFNSSPGFHPGYEITFDEGQRARLVTTGSITDLPSALLTVDELVRSSRAHRGYDVDQKCLDRLTALRPELAGIFKEAR